MKGSALVPECMHCGKRHRGECRLLPGDCPQQSGSTAPVQVDRPTRTVQRSKRPGRAETTDISQKIVSETVEKPEFKVAPRVYAMKAQEEPNPNIVKAIQGSEEAWR